MKEYLISTNRSHAAVMADKYANYLLRADDGAKYDQVLEVNLSELEPHISKISFLFFVFDFKLNNKWKSINSKKDGPFTPDLSHPISKFAEVIKSNKWPEDVIFDFIFS